MKLHGFLNRHLGKTAWIFGKGPSLDSYLESAEYLLQHHRPGTIKMAVNEAALVVHGPDYFFAHDILGIERTMNAEEHGFRGGAWRIDSHVQLVLHKYCVAIVRNEHVDCARKYSVDPTNVYGYRKAQEEKGLLKMSAVEIVKSGALYAESATIQSACHFAKLAGCDKVVLVGVDGGPEVAKVFKNMGCAKGPWYTKNRGDTHRILDTMGMPFIVWGE